jgi:hypothetical protein
MPVAGKPIQHVEKNLRGQILGISRIAYPASEVSVNPDGVCVAESRQGFAIPCHGLLQDRIVD